MLVGAVSLLAPEEAFLVTTPPPRKLQAQQTPLRGGAVVLCEHPSCAGLGAGCGSGHCPFAPSLPPLPHLGARGSAWAAGSRDAPGSRPLGGRVGAVGV